MSLVRAAAESAYELARKQKIKENNEMMKKLFGEHVSWPPVAASPKEANGGKTKSSTPRRQSKTAVRLPPRRNPKRQARSYDSPATDDDYHYDYRVDSHSDAESSDSESTIAPSGKRLLVRWVGPLTKKRRIASSGYCSNSSHSDSESTSPRKRRKPATERVIRPASDFTEEELLLVADSVSEKHYDKEFGTSCHQCRQKTDDLKTVCRNKSCLGIRGQFCGPCLRNRYGEDVRDALLDDDWSCPPCRGICNCSFCMPKRGRGCTGQLIGLARLNGFNDVRSFLGD